MTVATLGVLPGDEAAKPPRSSVVRDLALTWPLALFFLLFFVAPLLLLLAVSFFTTTEMSRMGLTQYAKFLLDSFSLGVLADTLILGFEVTALCVLLGYPLAYLFCRASRRVQSLLILVIVMPLLTSVIVRTFAWIVILGRQGIVNSLLIELGLVETPLPLLYTHWGVVAALAQVQMPLMVLPLINTLQRLDGNLADASAALGASHWRTFFKVTLPLSLPGIIAGSLLTFAASVTAFITQTLVGGGRLLYMPMYLYQQAGGLQNWPFAAAISIIFLIAVLVFVSLFNVLGRLSRGYAQA
jgi:putative spermidine/putrescine transport system permease protein